MSLHPYYAPAGGSAQAGLVSMAAYLAFWAVVVAIAGREVNRRFPREAPPATADPAVAMLRERYARGDLDRERFWLMVDDLRQTADRCRPPGLDGGRR